MVINESFIALALIVIAAFTVEAATGFGSIIIALAVGAYLYPLHVLLPILVVLDAILCAYLAARYHASIEWMLLCRRLLPWMIAGLLLGLFLSRGMSTPLLYRLFGILVSVFSARELWALGSGRAASSSLSPAGRAVSLASAGVVHGVFASGGPLLVYVLGRSTLDKGAFRSTLAAVWLILDLVLIATYAISGRMRAGAVLSAVVLVPSLFIAAVVGEWVHARLDERRFKLGVFAVLMAVGISIALEGVLMP